MLKNSIDFNIKINYMYFDFNNICKYKNGFTKYNIYKCENSTYTK